MNKLLVLVSTENEIYIYNSNLGLYNNNNFKFLFVEKIVYLDTNELGYRIDICPKKPIIALSSIDEFNIGCIHIYEYITNKWKRNVSITSKKPLPYDNFGYSISFDNNYVFSRHKSRFLWPIILSSTRKSRSTGPSAWATRRECGATIWRSSGARKRACQLNSR